MSFDVIVVGGGHAGSEAALASARLGANTLLLTLRPDKIASMPCNPSIGGIAKSHLVFELDALGGEMARNTDYAGIQFRVLNTRRGEAVRANRAQCDKYIYKGRMQSVMHQTRNLTVIGDEVVALILCGDSVVGVKTLKHGDVESKRVVLTAGTFLRGTIHIGHETIPGGGNGQPPSNFLADQLREQKFHVERLKTGTPSRLIPSSIDYSRMKRQDGDTDPIPFLSIHSRFLCEKCGKSAEKSEVETPMFHMEHSEDRNSIRSEAFHVEHSRCSSRASDSVFHVVEHGTAAEPMADPIFRFAPSGTGLLEHKADEYISVIEGQSQSPCWITHTTQETGKIVREHLSETALYGGDIVGVGPRYCPSFEDKVVKFAQRDEHHVFLEPESSNPALNLMYPNGLSTSLPRNVQELMVHSVPGLENAKFAAYAYAIEYDFYDPRDLQPSLESRLVHGLFFAGQVNGTTGYEEAAAQGFVAGVNAVFSLRDESPLVFARDEAYIGVLIDDLITKGTNEPYRMFTSRAENRLMLRQDAAKFRLLHIAKHIGIHPDAIVSEIESQKHIIDSEISRLNTEMQNGITLATLLHQDPNRRYGTLPGALSCSDSVAREIELSIRYSPYIEIERHHAQQLRLQEEKKIPPNFDFMSIKALRYESREKMQRVKPLNLGQALRIPGVTPADIAILSVAITRQQH